MFNIFQKKAIYPRQWPTLDCKLNKPNFKIENNRLVFDKKAALILFDEKQFSQATQAYLLSMFVPGDSGVYYVSIKSKLGHDLLHYFDLPNDSYIVYAKNDQLITHNLLIKNTDELDFITIENLACNLVAEEDVVLDNI